MTTGEFTEHLRQF